MKKRIPLLPTIIGSGFGSGFWPWGPGTMGALVATILWWAVSVVLSPVWLFASTIILCVVFTILGTWATNRLMPWWGEDPKRVVVDEMVGVWIPLLACPAGDVWYAVAAFALFRFFDIVKPLGIRGLDRRRGAFWVMADDILAGVYSLIVILLARWII